MNRLAQAFIQVSEGLARNRVKKAMPVTVAVCQLPNGKKRERQPPPRKPNKDDTAVNHKTEVDWRHTPPPVRADQPSPPPETAATETPASVLEAPVEAMETVCDIPPETPPVPLPAVPLFLPDEVAVDLGQRSAEATRGVATVPALLERISQTRRLTSAWKRAGRYLANPKRLLTKTTEEKDLAQRMDRVFELMEDYPGFVGHPGKPGYRVVAMARLELTEQMFKVLDATQREELARDWEAGAKVLCEHRRFLLGQLKQFKRRGRMEKLTAGAERFVRDHKRWFILGAVSLAALCIALLIW